MRVTFNNTFCEFNAVIEKIEKAAEMKLCFGLFHFEVFEFLIP